MKSYLLSHSEACTPEQVQQVLNDTRAVETWITPFPYAAILISQLDVRDLAAVIRDRLPGVWLMVTELNGAAVQGWLPADLWEYVNDPSKAWSRKLFSGVAPSSTSLPGSGLHAPGSFARTLREIRDSKEAASRGSLLGEGASGRVSPRDAPPRGPARRSSGLFADLYRGRPPPGAGAG